MKDTGIIKGEPTKENGLIPVELGDGSLIYAQWIPNSEPVIGQAVDIERTASGSMLATAKNSYNFNQLFQQSGLQKYAQRASWDVDFANGKIWNEPFGKPKLKPQKAIIVSANDIKNKIYFFGFSDGGDNWVQEINIPEGFFFSEKFNTSKISGYWVTPYGNSEYYQPVANLDWFWDTWGYSNESGYLNVGVSKPTIFCISDEGLWWGQFIVEGHENIALITIPPTDWGNAPYQDLHTIGQKNLFWCLHSIDGKRFIAKGVSRRIPFTNMEPLATDPIESTIFLYLEGTVTNQSNTYTPTTVLNYGTGGGETGRSVFNCPLYGLNPDDATLTEGEAAIENVFIDYGYDQGQPIGGGVILNHQMRIPPNLIRMSNDGYKLYCNQSVARYSGEHGVLGSNVIRADEEKLLISSTFPNLGQPVNEGRLIYDSGTTVIKAKKINGKFFRLRGELGNIGYTPNVFTGEEEEVLYDWTISKLNIPENESLYVDNDSFISCFFSPIFTAKKFDRLFKTSGGIGNSLNWESDTIVRGQTPQITELLSSKKLLGEVYKLEINNGLLAFKADTFISLDLETKEVEKIPGVENLIIFNSAYSLPI